MRSPRRWAIDRLCARRGHELRRIRREVRFRLPDDSIVLVTHRCHCGAQRRYQRLPR